MITLNERLSNHMKLVSARSLLFSLAAISLIFLTGCTIPFLPSSTSKPSGPITLKYWGLWEPESVMKQVISDYQTSHPNVTIQYQKQTAQQYRERLQARIASGEGPDIFRFHNTWTPMLKNELAPLPTTVMDNQTFEKTFYPTAKYDLKMGNNYYGIPLGFDGLALYYNEDLFKAANIQSPPATWEELRTISSRLTQKDPKTGQLKVSGVALGATSNVDHWSDILGLMMLQNGVEMTKGNEVYFNKSLTADTPPRNLGEDALSYYTLFVTQDKVWDPTWEPSTMAFSSGRVAMIFAPSWRVFDIRSANPALNFKIAPVPQLPGGTVSWASYWAEGVSAKSPNQAEAWAFLKYLSETQTLRKLYGEEAKTRLFGEPFSRQDMASSLQDEPYAGAYISSAPIARSWYLTSNTNDNGIDDKTIKYFEDAVNSVVGGGNPTVALETAAKGVTNVLTQYGLLGTMAAPSAPKK